MERISRSRRLLVSEPFQYRMFLAVTIVGMVQGLVMTSAGVFVRFQTGNWLRMQLQKDPVGQLYVNFFKPYIAPARAPLRLLSENIGNTLLYLGLVVIFVSDLGLCGALYLRTLLVLFMLMMTMLIMTELLAGVFVLHSRSYLNELGKEAATKTLVEHASLTDHQKLDNPWMNGLQLLMVVFDCCGVAGPYDFVQMYMDKFVPETCCTRHFMAQTVGVQSLPPCLNDISATDERGIVGDHIIRKCRNIGNGGNTIINNNDYDNINTVINNITDLNKNNNSNKGRNNINNKNNNNNKGRNNINKNNNNNNTNNNGSVNTTTTESKNSYNNSATTSTDNNVKNNITISGSRSGGSNKDDDDDDDDYNTVKVSVPDLSLCTTAKPHSTHGVQYQKSQGCYDAIFEAIETALPWLIPVLLIVLLTQMSMVSGAMYVFNKRITWTDRSPHPLTHLLLCL